MEYLMPKRKKDLVDTMRMLNENSYLIYEEDITNPANSNSYTVAKGSYLYGIEKYQYFNFDYGTVIGQYEIGNDLIIFEVEITTENLGYKKYYYYEYYSISEDKFLKFPAKITRISKRLVNVVNLKENDSDKDKYALHVSCNGYNGKILKNNTVDFFIGLPRFNLVTDVYSSLQDKVIKTRKFDDIKKIINQDYEDECTINYWYKIMNYDASSEDAEVKLLRKIK